VTGKIKVVKRDAPYRGYTQRRLRVIPIGSGLPDLKDMQKELAEYMDVLLGRADAPIQGAHALMETADMYYARSSELIMIIQRGETDGTISKGSDLARFRTGELRTFQELSKAASALGSRRLTSLSIEVEQAKLGRESA
jgi:hypothetical protein